MRNKVTPAPPHQTNKQQVIKVNAKNYHSITDFIWCDDGKEGAPAIDLTWLKRTTDAPDLGVGVTITPDRKVVTMFGWEGAEKTSGKGKEVTADATRPRDRLPTRRM